MKTLKTIATVAGLIAGLGANLSHAAFIPVYEGPAIDWSASPACLAIGDGVGCSLPLLNYLSGLPGTTETPTGYVIKTNQGASGLDPYLILQAGGGAYDNTSPYGNTAVVEDGFKSNDASADSYAATGMTSTTAGNLSNPDNNGLLATQDLLGTWDVGLDWLINALSPDGIRRELMIGFDYNQQQNDGTSLDYWALITVRDTNGNLVDMNFEIRSATGLSPYAFSTGKTIDSKPYASDFSTVNGITCVDGDGVLPILPLPGGQCPSDYEVTLNNAQSTESTEIVAFLPEVNDGLEGWLKDGYDTISVRMLFGCFGSGSSGKKSGIGYLEGETAGATNNCDNGGFGDVFILAGAPEQQVPEPASLLLVALSLLGLGVTISRKRIH